MTAVAVIIINLASGCLLRGEAEFSIRLAAFYIAAGKRNQ